MAVPSTTPQVPKGSAAVNAANVISTASEIVTSVATTIAGVRDERLRTNFQQNLALLTNEQQIALSKLLNNAKDENERLKILASTLTSSTSDRIGNIANLISQQEKNRRTQLVTNSIQAAAFFVVAGVVIYLVTKKA